MAKKTKPDTATKTDAPDELAEIERRFRDHLATLPDGEKLDAARDLMASAVDHVRQHAAGV